MSKPAIPHGDLLVAPEHRSWVEASLSEVAELEIPEDLAQSVDLDDEDFWAPEYGWARPYRVRNGDLFVPVKGILLHDFPYAFGSFATGYDYIRAAVRRGSADPAVERIILHINSPGGLVSGCFDAADEIYEARGTKPIIAVADEHAYSAGYAIASAADEIVVARTGGVGSVGVIAAYVEFSRMLEDSGVTYNLIFAGDRKADGHPAIPLSDEARARAQSRIDSHYEIFVATVSRNRGLGEDAVRATEADAFTAREAVENGLADSVGNLGTLSAEAENLNDQEDDTMSKENSAVDQAAHEAAVSEATAAGRTEGALAERERIAAILDSDEAAARPAAARMLAFDTDKDPESAKASLAKLPEEGASNAAPAQATPSQFEQQMNASGGPGVGAGEAEGGSGEEELSDSDVVTGIFASAGYKAAR